ncbi:metalloregulator ArsR/SmtB family transcription factor [Sphingomonas sp. MG17]|uniref:Metalloregulator ArsR/SmtB family transcription factor n=1 Tax=Sphingomonas tagetis TaxID=2949092 RepID=A0A9X2KKA5_9SPHN|nr:metalloregulator ArsR/SmtB family transcription factor [Sphingomonas tagetis]MCP3729146.1 metalloregulator ArsR/SmtB family transcription factor [Sphingomonas tagetis]
MESLDLKFAALADPTRRAILARLAKGEASVTDLAQPFALSQPAISKHLRVLERAGLIETSRAAQSRPRRLKREAIAEPAKWLELLGGDWDAKFDRLDAYLSKLAQGDEK